MGPVTIHQKVAEKFLYLARIKDANSNVQEILAYLDTMVEARRAQIDRPLRN